MQNTTRIGFTCLCLLASLLATASSAQEQPRQHSGDTDGQHDFDWETGTWKTQVRRLVNPLSGSQEWVEYTGTSVVRELLDGRANLVELRVEGTAGRIHGTSLRLYNPQTRQWSLRQVECFRPRCTAASTIATGIVSGSFTGRRTSTAARSSCASSSPA